MATPKINIQTGAEIRVSTQEATFDDWKLRITTTKDADDNVKNIIVDAYKEDDGNESFRAERNVDSDTFNTNISVYDADLLKAVMDLVEG